MKWDFHYGMSFTSYNNADPLQTKIYRPETNLGRAMSLGGTGFIPSGENFVVVHLVWGMGPRDFSACHKTDHRCNGRQVWRDTFDMNTPPAQMALLVG